jgi:tetratricopeptide (TPR) repeat protein
MAQLFSNNNSVWRWRQGWVRGCHLYVAIVWAMLPLFAAAQSSPFLKKGNDLYNQQRYDLAADNYLKAIQRNPNDTASLFNLGNALYQQKQYEASRKSLTATANTVKDRTHKAAANYNIGNTYMAERKWDEAINAYKTTLRNNPQDADAKYNLAYAQQMKKKEDQKGGGKNDKKNQDKNQQQNKDKNKDDKENQDQQQDQNNKDKQDEKEQKPQSQPSKLSQQQADQLLNALQQEEKKLQDKLKKEKGIPVKLDKDW